MKGHLFLLHSMKDQYESDYASETSSETTVAETLASIDTVVYADYFPDEETIATHTQRPHVSFGSICIREYQRTLGDNPAVSSGPPISLDWDYDPNEQILSVDEYEKKNESGTKKQVKALSRFKREKILEEEFGISRIEMKASMREVTNIQQARKLSYANRNSEKIAERAEALQRKVSKVLGLRKSQKKQMEKLLQEASDHSSTRNRETRSTHYDRPAELYSFINSSTELSASMSL